MRLLGIKLIIFVSILIIQGVLYKWRQIMKRGYKGMKFEKVVQGERESYTVIPKDPSGSLKRGKSSEVYHLLV